MITTINQLIFRILDFRHCKAIGQFLSPDQTPLLYEGVNKDLL
jgi:hypothetical protein